MKQQVSGHVSAAFTQVTGDEVKQRRDRVETNRREDLLQRSLLVYRLWSAEIGVETTDKYVETKKSLQTRREN